MQDARVLHYVRNTSSTRLPIRQQENLLLFGD